MSNPFKSALVYLGMAEEDTNDYEEEPTSVEPQSYPAPVTPAPARAERSERVERSERAERAAERAERIERIERADRSPVVPFRKPTAVKTQAVPEMNEILTVHPRQYKDAPSIAEAFRDGIPVIINLSQVTDADAQRLIDFAGGLKEGLRGKLERVTSKVFLLSPAHVSVLTETGQPAASVASVLRATA